MLIYLYNIYDTYLAEKSAFEYGLVNHALAAAMRTLVKVSCGILYVVLL